MSKYRYVFAIITTSIMLFSVIYFSSDKID